MAQLDTLRELVGSDQPSDVVLQFYLDNASDIICDLRDTDAVETKYLNTQIKMALELVAKHGAEGQISHTENGISRTYESADISSSLLSQITPIIRTPWSTTRTVT